MKQIITQSQLHPIVTLTLLFTMLCITGTGCDVNVSGFDIDENGYAQTELSNGITLLVNQDETTALTACRILIGGGALTENADNNGITNLMTRMLLKGNAKMDAAQIAEALDFFGANVSVGCRRDYATISFTSLSENFPQVLSIIATSLESPTFPESELIKLKQEVEGDIVSSNDNQTQASSKLFYKTAYGDHAYGLPTLGTVETIADITVADLQVHYENYVGGGNMIAAISTDLNVHELPVMFEEELGRLKRDASTVDAPVVSLQAEKNGFISYDRSQSFIYMGYVMKHLEPAEVPCILLLNEIMGSNVGSRLWYLRQEEKLAYTVYTHYATDKYGAMFRAGIGTDTTKVHIALESLEREWALLYADGVSEDELTDARINMKNNLIYQIDRKSNRANNMAYYHWMGYSYRFVLYLIEQADQVTLAELNAFIKNKLMEDRKYVSIVGKQ
jgi:zinc protease